MRLWMKVIATSRSPLVTGLDLVERVRRVDDRLAGLQLEPNVGIAELDVQRAAFVASGSLRKIVQLRSLAKLAVRKLR